ncbi:MAG: nuclear transport factor 2 family protein [Nitrospinae bacterium]|nr:nuclear transport factor 2 family protein [Nitrospinota bacterium]
MTQEDIAREKAAIAELIARYNLAVDHNDFPGYAACFTPDGIFDGIIGRFAVHQELDRFIEAVQKLAATAPNFRHFVTNILTEIHGDAASSRSFILMTSTTQEGGARIAAVGEYEDRLVKIGGQWLFRERKVHIDGA